MLQTRHTGNSYSIVKVTHLLSVLCSTSTDEKDPGACFIFTFDQKRYDINKTKTQYMKNFYPSLLNICIIHATHFYVSESIAFCVLGLSAIIHLGGQRNLLSERKEPSSNKETVFFAFVK